MAIATEHYAAISDHLGRYCRVGDDDAWVARRTEDGVFSGATPEPCVGREALKIVRRFETRAAHGGCAT
jgi:hypothetical protein